MTGAGQAETATYFRGAETGELSLVLILLNVENGERTPHLCHDYFEA